MQTQNDTTEKIRVGPKSRGFKNLTGLWRKKTSEQDETSDETEWGWGRVWKPLLLYSEPPGKQ